MEESCAAVCAGCSAVAGRWGASGFLTVSWLTSPLGNGLAPSAPAEAGVVEGHGRSTGAAPSRCSKSTHVCVRMCVHVCKCVHVCAHVRDLGTRASAGPFASISFGSRGAPTPCIHRREAAGHDKPDLGEQVKCRQVQRASLSGQRPAQKHCGVGCP